MAALLPSEGAQKRADYSSSEKMESHLKELVLKQGI